MVHINKKKFKNNKYQFDPDTYSAEFLLFNRFGDSVGSQSKLQMVFKDREKHRCGTCEPLFEYTTFLSVSQD